MNPVTNNQQISSSSSLGCNTPTNKATQLQVPNLHDLSNADFDLYKVAIADVALSPRTVTVPSLFHIASSGDLLVWPQVKTDPALSKWLETHTAAALKIDGQGNQLNYLFNVVQSTFRYTNQSLLHPFRHRTFQDLIERESNSVVLLGDFIHNRTGVCRHGTMLLQLACQRIGLSSIMVYGELAIVDPDKIRENPKISETIRSLQGHMWVLASTEGKVQTVDSTHGIFLLENWNSKLDPTALHEIYTNRTRSFRASYRGDTLIYKNIDSARTFCRDLSDPDTIASAKRAIDDSIQFK